MKETKIKYKFIISITLVNYSPKHFSEGSSQERPDGQGKSDWQESEDKKEGVSTLEEAIGNKLLNLK